MAGTGALGDIGAHMIDNVTWILCTVGHGKPLLVGH